MFDWGVDLGVRSLPPYCCDRLLLALAVSWRTDAIALSLVLMRVLDRPAEMDRGVPGVLLEESDMRSADLARFLFSSSIRRLYSRARSRTEERDDCVDLYDTADRESPSVLSPPYFVDTIAGDRIAGILLLCRRLLGRKGVNHTSKSCSNDTLLYKTCQFQRDSLVRSMLQTIRSWTSTVLKFMIYTTLVYILIKNWD